MWISECCGDEPDYRFTINGEEVGFPTGVCSGCLEHADFEKDKEE